MKDEVLVTCLCYLNENNIKRRQKNFLKSINSLKLLKNQPCRVIAINNNCCDEAKKIINNIEGIDDIIDLSRNFWDIATIFASAYIAKKLGYKYCCYTYDDFVVYDDNFVSQCVKFLNDHQDVGCIRITKYEFDNKDLYNSEIIPKSINPDSVRHYSKNNVKRTNLQWEGPFKIQNRVFYKNNWHYSSRPAIWKTDVLYSFFENHIKVPVMQPFERHGTIAFYHTGLKTGVLDNGAMYTFLESERTSLPGHRSKSQGRDVLIKIQELINEIDNTNLK